MSARPEDSIMDMVNNVEWLYLKKMALYNEWLGLPQDPSYPRERDFGRLARYFARMLGGNYRIQDIKDAKREMLEEYEDYKKYNWNTGMVPPGKKEWRPRP